MRGWTPKEGTGSIVQSVAFVCTANRARSPFAAALLRRHLAGSGIEVESFGTLDQAGTPALLPAVRSARAFGVDLTAHRSRRIGSRTLIAHDLVIGFEAFHVATAVVDGGASGSRTFLLTELAEMLLEGDEITRGRQRSLAELVADLDARRQTRQQVPRPLADPVGASDRRFFELYHEIDRLVAIVASRLFSGQEPH